ncbi:GH22976 [Drosophila grimshawi]|uniref:GH22976 n=2 Tax=Drosophila grimshawi TaxID=7222 RepID=B4JW47_DROGR|nr:GH22976 [Drosophila grimshawi]
MNKKDPISMIFHDSCLRMSDVHLLQGPFWLSDQILSFYYEYLSHVKYKNNKDVYFIAPEVTQCMKYMDDSELELLFEKQNAYRKRFMFFALNDNESSSEGGTHWSLLVLSLPQQTFFHFDSCGNSNVRASRRLMNKVKYGLGMQQTRFRAMNCLQQANGFDCGIHVICTTDHIVDHLNRYGFLEGLPTLPVELVMGKRSELLNLILFLGGKI